MELKIECIPLDKDHLLRYRCEADTKQIYPQYSASPGAARCFNKARYRIDGEYLCKVHAGLTALGYLLQNVEPESKRGLERGT